MPVECTETLLNVLQSNTAVSNSSKLTFADPDAYSTSFAKTSLSAKRPICFQNIKTCKSGWKQPIKVKIFRSNTILFSLAELLRHLTVHGWIILQISWRYLKDSMHLAPFNKPTCHSRSQSLFHFGIPESQSGPFPIVALPRLMALYGHCKYHCSRIRILSSYLVLGDTPLLQSVKYILNAIL